VEILVKMANFVDLDATPAEMDGLEVSEPQAGGDGGAERDLRRLDWGRERNFESAGDLGGLDGNLPDVNEIVHSEDFSCERKGVGVEGNENEGPGTPQKAPNVENIEMFKPGVNFTWIPFASEIGAMKNVNRSGCVQYTRRCERTYLRPHETPSN
jgi:hypothetical protein